MHDPLATIQRLVDATNTHDLERLVACFADDYSLTAPSHPQRGFRGRDQVRRNWTHIFAAVPDITTQLVRTTVDGDAVWTEWEMAGTRRDGTAHRTAGVFIFGVTDGQIRWGRMFLEPVDTTGSDIDAVVRAQVGAKP
jgi:ketosteroid isomerase-like protein